MKILLDESLPKRLKEDLKVHNVKTVPEAGWQGKKNGELLRLMTGKYDVFITADQNLQYQLNLRNTTVAIVVLVAPTNRYQDLKKLIKKLLKQLKSPTFTRVTKISI